MKKPRMTLSRRCSMEVLFFSALIALSPLANAETAPLNAAPVPGSTPSVAGTTPPSSAPSMDVPFIQLFPNLNEYLYKEPKSGFYLGFGASPLALVKDRTEFGANFFQVHYLSDRWDLELLNVSYAVTRGQSSAYQSNNFVLRSSAKIRIGKLISFGPLVGYEYVSFPNLGATLLKIPYQSPDEPFSSRGVIYGAMLTETIRYKEDYLIQINQVVYQETYSYTTTPEGWKYSFDRPDVQANPALIGPGIVTMIELSFLF